MRNPFTSFASCRRLTAADRPTADQCGWAVVLSSLTLGFVLVGWTSRSAAQTPAPPELTTTIEQIDAAASEGKVEAVMRFYSPEFTSSDGLTYATLETLLGELWQRYPNLSYETQIESWEQQGSGFSAVTTTTITGVYPDERRDLNLSATITSRQRFEDSKIVAQEILAERSELRAGEQPPTVTFNLPEQVNPGQRFDFDAIVAEPLGNRLLLGAAIEEPIEVENYLNPAPIELELLSSGGLFKVGRAPTNAGNRWISAVIVHYDGITAVTQRLRIGN
jgi:hypothetical protein